MLPPEMQLWGPGGATAAEAVGRYKGTGAVVIHAVEDASVVVTVLDAAVDLLQAGRMLHPSKDTPSSSVLTVSNGNIENS